MEPTVPTVVVPTTPPAQEAPPAWAQQLIDQQADITSRLAAFEETVTPPAPPAPEPEEQPGWKPSSWDDVDTRAEEKARKIVEDTLAEREATAKTANEQQAAAAAEVDKFLDNQVAELIKDTKLPAVSNENDPNDPGKLAQRELYGFALSLGTADLKTSHATLQALHQAGKKFDFVKMELVDDKPHLLGQQSPVGSSNSGASSSTQKIEYKTIRNNSLQALADRFMQ